MGNIVLLDDLTINKIAAGEVIERPASVVKEMVENSIDAGAKNITIEISNGGISLIKITDDGCGIAEDDMEIAFERHATSKIRKAEDLTSVTTMGFRGEALASIASIAKVEMVSKKADSETAHRIVVEGGKILSFQEAARSVGTTITVTNLFYNTPVRYKFLKKDFTEAGYIEDIVTRIALVNKDVAIKLINKGKTIIQTAGNGDLKTVVYSIYGKDTATEVINIDYTYEDIKVEGVIGKPVTARGNRSNQLFFLNGRYIKDKNLTAAADQSYKGMIPVGRYGFIVLNLVMDPKYADVNVHPAKLEVRFTDESKIFKAVYHAIKSGLAESELVENVEKEKTLSAKEELNKIMNSSFVSQNMTNNENTSTINNSANSVNLNNNSINTVAVNDSTDINSNNTVSTDLNSSTINNEENNEKYEVSAKSNSNENLILEENDSASNNVVSQDKHGKDKKGKGGLFSKILREPEETKEEINNNYLEDIFKYRQKLKEDTEKVNLAGESINSVADAGFEDIQKAFSDMFSNINNDVKVAEELSKVSENVNTNLDSNNILNNNTNNFVNMNAESILNASKTIADGINAQINPKTINDFEVDNKVSLNDTVISSNTREIDVDNVNKLIKDATQMINSMKFDKINAEETQKIDLNAELKNKVSSETQVLNTEDVRNNNLNVSQNTTVIPKEMINSIPEHTQVLDAVNTKNNITANSNDSLNNLNNVIVNEVKDEVPEENLDITSNGFAAMAEKMVESKFDFDSTQMIDTSKVRDALKNEEKDEEVQYNPEFDSMYSKTFGVETVAQRRAREAAEAEKNRLNAANDFSYPQENMTVFEDSEEEAVKIPYKFLGIAFSTYIIIELKDEMYIVDQHAAHERIMYEKVKENYFSDDEKNEQFLLLPDVITLTHKEMMVARENVEMFGKAGFTFEEFGENTIKLMSVPSMCEDMNTKQLFLDILDEVDTVAVTARQEKEDKFIATIACKAAVKGNMKLDEKEVDSLMNKLLELPNPFTCPHGRPTAIKMTRADLERKFSRR